MSIQSTKLSLSHKSIAEWKQLLLLILVAMVVIYWRNPLFFIMPRVFAEEPGSYLLNALTRPLPSSLGFTMAGYFSIVPNFAAELAGKLFPLDLAAHVFTGIGLLVQLLTVISIYFSVGRLLPNRKFSFLSAIFLLFIAKPETWLNTVYSMYWLATGMFYLLNSRYIRRYHVFYAALAFLTGPTSLVLLPLFGLRWLIGYDKYDKWNKRIGLINVIGLTALILNLSLSFGFNTNASLGSRLAPEMLRNLPRGFLSMFAHLFASGGYPAPLAIFMLIASGTLIAKLLLSSEIRFRIFVGGSLVYYGFIVAVLSFDMQGGNRYALPVTAGIFSMAVLGLGKTFRINSRDNRPGRIACFLFGLILLMGNKVVEFHDFSGIYAASNYNYDIAWPNWKEQIDNVDRSKGGVIWTFPQWEGTGLQGGDWQFVLPAGVGK